MALKNSKVLSDEENDKSNDSLGNSRVVDSSDGNKLDNSEVLSRQQKIQNNIQEREQISQTNRLTEGVSPTEQVFQNIQEGQDLEFSVVADQDNEQQQANIRSSVSTPANPDPRDTPSTATQIATGIAKGGARDLLDISGEAVETVTPLEDVDERALEQAGLEDTPSLTKEVAQGTARDIGALGQPVAEALTFGAIDEPNFDSVVADFIYGENTEELGFAESGREIRGAERQGESEGVFNVVDPVLGVSLSLVDALPGAGSVDEATRFGLRASDDVVSGVTDTVRRSADEIAQTSDTQRINEILQQNLDEDLLRQADEATLSEDLSRVSDELSGVTNRQEVRNRANRFQQTTTLNRVQEDISEETGQLVDDLQRAESSEDVFRRLTDQNTRLGRNIKDDIARESANKIARTSNRSEIVDQVSDVVLRSFDGGASNLSNQFLPDVISPRDADQRLTAVENQIESAYLRSSNNFDDVSQGVKQELDEAAANNTRPSWMSDEISIDTVKELSEKDDIAYSRDLSQNEFNQAVNETIDQIDIRTGVQTQDIRESADTVLAREIDESQTAPQAERALLDNTRAPAGQKSKMFEGEEFSAPTPPPEPDDVTSKPQNQSIRDYIFEDTQQALNERYKVDFSEEIRDKLDTITPTRTLEDGDLKNYQSFRGSLEDYWTNIREFAEDNWIRVKKLMRDENVEVTEANDAYMAETLMHGRVGGRASNIKNDVRKIDRDMRTFGNRYNMTVDEFEKEVNDYLLAKHAPERNAVHGEKAAGITDEQAQKVLNKIDESEYSSEVKNVADRIRAINDKMLDTLRDGSLIGDDLYNQLREQYSNHVPLYRLFDESEAAGNKLNMAGKALDQKSNGLQRAVGSQRDIESIYGNVVFNYKQALKRAEQNRVNLSTLKFAEDNKDLDLFKKLDPQEGQKRAMRDDDRVLTARLKGEPQYLEIKDDSLATAFKNTNTYAWPDELRAVANFTRIYAGLNTRYVPGFAFSNKVRDLQEMATYMAAKKEGGFKAAGRAVSREKESAGAIMDWLRGKDTPRAQLYEQMRMDGGTTGGLGLSSTKDAIETDLKDIRARTRSATRRTGANIARYVNNWNKIFEDSTRLSAYKEALNNGASRQRAAFIAKNASINFNKKGTAGNFINGAYMFANASIQGSRKMLHAMKDPKVAAGVISTVTGATYAVNSWNDTIDPDWRNKVTAYDRKASLPIMIPDGSGGVTYFTIPVSWGLKPVKVAADETYDMAFSDKETNVAGSVGKITTSMANAYNPVGGNDLISVASPTITDIPFDLARNRAWYGGKIAPDFNRNAPDHIQYFESLEDTATGEKAIGLTRGLSQIGIEWSPNSVVYGVEQIIGGAGRTVTDTLNTVQNLTDEDVPAKQTLSESPITQRFIQRRSEEELGSESEGIKEINQLLKDQAEERFYLEQKAEEALQQFQEIPKQEANKRFKQLQEVNPRLADELEKVKREKENQLTYTQRRIKDLGVENGMRAKYVWKKIQDLETPELKNELYKEYKEKGIISDQVDEQIRTLKDRATQTEQGQ